MNFERRGKGKLLLLIHGIGGSWKSWNTMLDDLAKHNLKDLLGNKKLELILFNHAHLPYLTRQQRIQRDNH